jgi:exopolysaccharide biosynthesis protein
MLKFRYSLIIALLVILSSCSQDSSFINTHIKSSKEEIGFLQIKTDTIFDSNQTISFLKVNNNSLDRFKIDFIHNDTILTKTSVLAKMGHAIAAVNGGFFNMDKGMSSSYFEENDSVIAYPINPELKWGITNLLMNGAIVITKNHKIIIQPAKDKSFYESSKNESAVLITGPLLLQNSKKVELTDMKFVTMAHPRTFLCTTNNAVVFITVDGRTEDSKGMTLFQAQKFLLSIGCVNAINLDGGGSTTMWIKDKGVVNFPSDKEGERTVSNAMIIVDVNKN